MLPKQSVNLVSISQVGHDNNVYDPGGFGLLAREGDPPAIGKKVPRLSWSICWMVLGQVFPVDSLACAMMVNQFVTCSPTMTSKRNTGEAASLRLGATTKHRVTRQQTDGMTDQDKLVALRASGGFQALATYTNGRGEKFENKAKKCEGDTYNMPPNDDLRTTHWDQSFTNKSREGWKTLRVKSPTLCCLCFKFSTSTLGPELEMISWASAEKRLHLLTHTGPPAAGGDDAKGEWASIGPRRGVGLPAHEKAQSSLDFQRAQEVRHHLSGGRRGSVWRLLQKGPSQTQ